MGFSGAPTVEYNPFDPGFAADPYTRWAELRALGGIVEWEAAEALVVTSFATARAVLENADEFSASRNHYRHNTPIDDSELPHLAEAARGALFHLDGDAHRRVRRAVTAAFTPASVATLAPSLRARTALLFDELAAATAATDTADLAPAAGSMPVEVIGEYLGFDAGRTRWLIERTDTIFALVDPFAGHDVRVACDAVLGELSSVIDAELQARRREPRDDLLGRLAALEDPLSAGEVTSLVVALLMAGAETTSNLFTLGTLTLTDHPETIDAARAGNFSVAELVEELLRFSYIGFAVTRYATRDTTLATADGTTVTVPAGTLIVVSIGAALHDPATVEQPDRLWPQRPTLPPLAFGVGARHCLGAALARAEAAAFFTEWLRRDIAVTGAPEYAPHFALRTMTSLPVTVTERRHDIAD